MSPSRLVLFAALVISSAIVFAQAPVAPVNDRPNPYQTIENRVPHAASLAFDSQGSLFVADRGNVRLQIFDQDGKFITETKTFSRLSGIYIDKNDMLYGADSESSETSHPGGWKRGMRIGSAKDLTVQYFIPDPEKNATGTSAAEGVAVDAQGNIYGAEVGPKAIKKYVKKPAT